MTKHHFHKSERLKSRKTLGILFTEGNSFSAYPLRVHYLYKKDGREEKNAHVQFTVSVSKKKFPKAVDRNRIKRQVREAYRLHKAVLLEKLNADNKQPHQYLAILMNYMPDKKIDFSKIEKGVHKGIQRLLVEIDK